MSSLTNRSRGVKEYESILLGCHKPPWMGATLISTLRERLLAAANRPVLAVDFGCGVGVAAAGLSAEIERLRLPARCIGIDRGYVGLCYGDPFPDTIDRLSSVLARHGDRIGLGVRNVDELPSLEIVRHDVESYPWPIASNSVHLAVSCMSVMYLVNKLEFLERVYDSLAPGGVAAVQLDQRDPTDPKQLQRVSFGPTTHVERRLEAARSDGIDIWGSGDYVVFMRKRPNTRLTFGLCLWRSKRRPGTRESWGHESYYR